jgi:hypothetical protein
MIISETADAKAPWRILPVGDTEWIAAKIERLAKAFDLVRNETLEEAEKVVESFTELGVFADEKVLKIAKAIRNLRDER